MNDVRPSETTISDDQLVARAQAGDRSAFESLYLRHARRLATLLSVRFRGRQEDLLQEAFLKAWCSLDQFLGGNFAAWVYRIAQRCGIDEARRPRPQPLAGVEGRGTGPDQEPPQIVVRDEEEKVKLERETQLRSCLEKLEDRARAVIVSRYGGVEEHAAVCGRLGITEKRGYKIRHYALKQLRRCMERGSR